MALYMNSLITNFLLLVLFCLSCVICLFLFLPLTTRKVLLMKRKRYIHFLILCLTIWCMQLLNYYAALLQCVRLQTSPRHPHGWFWRIPPLLNSNLLPHPFRPGVSAAIWMCNTALCTNAANRTTLYIGLQLARPYFYFNCENSLFLWWFYFCFFSLQQILFGNNILMSLLICNLYCSFHDLISELERYVKFLCWTIRIMWKLLLDILMLTYLNV